MAPIKVHRSGWIFKKGGLIKSTKKRWLILNDEEIMYYESLSATNDPPIDRIYLRVVTCAENTNKVEPIKSRNYFEFLIKTTTGRDYQMYAETEEERNLWVDAINKIMHAKKTPVKSFEKATDPSMYGIRQ